MMTLQLKEYKNDSLSQNLMTNSLLIFLFSRNCELEIVLPVVQIKTKTILRSQLVQNT
jgi:hypothetical protein